MSPRALADLARLLHLEEPGPVLREYLEQHPEVAQLADPRLSQLTDQELRSVLVDWVHGQRVSARDRRQREAQAVAKAAARSLCATARREGDDLVLDGPVVLGDLLRDRTMKHIGFVLDERELCVRRTKLREFARVWKRLPGVEVRLTPEELIFSWRGGLGGLRLVGQLVPTRDRERVLWVRLDPPAARPLVQSAKRAVDRGAWVGDVLADLGFL